jgi:hypothetical protein
MNSEKDSKRRSLQSKLLQVTRFTLGIDMRASSSRQAHSDLVIPGHHVEGAEHAHGREGAWVQLMTQAKQQRVGSGSSVGKRTKHAVGYIMVKCGAVHPSLAQLNHYRGAC